MLESRLRNSTHFPSFVIYGEIIPFIWLCPSFLSKFPHFFYILLFYKVFWPGRESESSAQEDDTQDASSGGYWAYKQWCSTLPGDDSWYKRYRHWLNSSNPLIPPDESLDCCIYLSHRMKNGKKRKKGENEFRLFRIGPLIFSFCTLFTVLFDGRNCIKASIK